MASSSETVLGVSGIAALPLSVFQERLASRQPVPGGGGATALTVASGAALAAMAARLAGRRIADSGLIVQQMDALRRHALLLIDRDAAAYQRVLDSDEGNRPAALVNACEAPIGMAEVGAEVAETAVPLVLEGNPRLAGDARAGAMLAQSGVRTAVMLVTENLRGVPGGEARQAHAERLAGRANAALSRLVSQGDDR